MDATTDDAAINEDSDNLTLTLLVAAFALANDLGREEAARFVLGILLVGRVAKT